VSISIDIPTGGPLFEGHFPRRPILPGVAELAMVIRALRPAAGPKALRAIPFLRFRGIVVPKDTLVLEARLAVDGAVRFELRRGGDRVADGAMHFGKPDDRTELGVTGEWRPPQGLPRLDELLPHRPPMRFVERVVDETEEGITCLARLPGDCALVDQGTALAAVALEAAAQTAAVRESLRHWREATSSQPRICYLVSVRDAVLYRETIPADVDLYAAIRLVTRSGPLCTYAVEVMTEDAMALRGMIGTYLSDE